MELSPCSKAVLLPMAHPYCTPVIRHKKRDPEISSTEASSLDITVYLWPTQTRDFELPAHGKTKFIELPRPPRFHKPSRKEVMECPEEHYFSWIERLPGHREDLNSPCSDCVWMRKCEGIFLRSLIKTVEIACSRGRSVWFMVRPLNNSLVPRGSEARTSFSHWGVLISDLAKCQLEDRLVESPNAKEVLGDLHELRNVLGMTRYDHLSYRIDDYKKATKLEYLGQTEMELEDILAFGEQSHTDIY
jgi:hypothetical protein